MKVGIQVTKGNKNPNALDDFVSKIYSYKQKSVTGFAEYLAKIAENNLRRLYAGSKITVQTIVSNGGQTATILANGQQISYLEFGTGIVGKNKGYEGNLPTQSITFFAHGTQVVVNGWTYNYAKDLGLTNSDWIGNGAQAQVWSTAQWLRADIIYLAQEYFGTEAITK